ncbi:hypothetical protein MAR_023245 [Mya arenaria]|uniref:Uncharacterized protein n=1 Tax=Mya arenaria TaxID=6604 RepID=A0ABY7DMG9_MYAAR|nr:hypothetical protein MAR_023245 [Mya arenaria]
MELKTFRRECYSVNMGHKFTKDNRPEVVPIPELLNRDKEEANRSMTGLDTSAVTLKDNYTTYNLYQRSNVSRLNVYNCESTKT